MTNEDSSDNQIALNQNTTTAHDGTTTIKTSGKDEKPDRATTPQREANKEPSTPSVATSTKSKLPSTSVTAKKGGHINKKIRHR